jgi:MinD-like ATPase involved in chromosome partitioning or flagellar assembly
VTDDQLDPRPADDVDSRAAELMARLAARQGRSDDAPRDTEPGPGAIEPPAHADPGPESSQRTGRRMAAPPWQQASDAPRVEPLSQEEQPPGPRPELRPDRRPGPPPPPPEWNGPPPPPGWPGPPPWMLPRPDRTRPAPPADDAGSRRRRPGPPSAAPDQVRHGRAESVDSDHRGVTRAARPFQNDDHSQERPTPQFGWRRVVYRATGGRVNPGASEKDREQQDLLEEIRQPLGGDFRIAVLSIKGGVGKTTTTIGLGSAFAMVRADRVIAVDANPDRGTLAERISDPSTSSTVRDLLLAPDVSRYADVRRHTRMAPSRLEVLASVQDPAVAEIYGESDYRRTIEILQAHYNIILTDCGTGIMHSSMASVLDLAHALVLVSSPAVDAARSAASTLDWLSQHGYGMLARESHVVLSGAQPGSRSFDEVFEYFEARSGSIHVVPFEPHLARGADIDFAMLSPDAARAYLELAGAVARKFPRVG